MNKIPEHLIRKIETTIQKYSLLSQSTVYVSYSGGKDSFFLCAALSQLGYKVIPVTVDIGFDADWSFARENLSRIGLDFLVLDKQYIITYLTDIWKAVSTNFDLLQLANKRIDAKATICTYCYNAKIIILSRWAEKNGVSEIAFGHHGTDAIASLLKSFYMYIDRWDHQFEEFDRNRFERLVKSEALMYRIDTSRFLESELYKRIKQESNKHMIGTDEPIRQHIGTSFVEISRPMYSVFENEILDYYFNENMIVGQSECFSTNTRLKEYRTPREMINEAHFKEANPEILDVLLQISLDAIDSQGYLLYNVRNQRDDILGGHYKGGFGNDIKL